MKKICFLFMLVASVTSFSQEISLDDKGVDKHSYKPIPESHIMYKKMLWRMIDLREKQNQPFFAQGREVTQVIIDAVKKGKIQPWKSDSLSDGQPLEVKDFLERLIIPAGDDGFGGEEELGFFDDESDPFNEGTDGGGDVASTEKPKNKNNSQTFYYEGKDLWQLEIKENLIFDKQRSVRVHDIQALTIVIPADHPDNVKGIEEIVASFSYKELIENVFTNNPEAIWYNPYNDKEHKSLADAFELRLFHSYLTKINNPTNERITDIYGGDPEVGIRASHLEEEKMLEIEHNFWSY